ncbi:MAG: N-acetylmuramoyl-L-alanine amidase [Desulfitobacterium sp.]
MKKVIMTILVSLTFVLSTSTVASASPLAYPIERIAGQDRVETALSISQKGWTTAETVILCEYGDYPDSIAATPYAVSLNAPILLTQGNGLDSRVKEELIRLQPQKVVLLGGTGVLKPSIEQELGKLDLSVEVERIGGTNRYDTSILLAQRVPSDTVILANGDDFPDALSAASFAGIKQIPIVLTSKKIPELVLTYLNETQPSEIIVIGGEGVIPSAGLTDNGFTITTRLGGQNRYETNASVVSHVKDAYATDDLFLASGITFPDAVAGTVLAAKAKAPLLLTEKQDVPSPVYTYMREHMKVEPPRKIVEAPKNKPQQASIIPSGGLNLRDTPSSSGVRIITIPHGTTLTLLEEKNGWYKTSFESHTGWVSAEYITLIDQTAPTQQNPPAAPDKKREGTITPSTGLNLRLTPSSTGEKLVTIPKDTTIQILEEQTGWYKTTYQSHTGWIAAEYVALTSSATEETGTAPLKSGLITAANGLNLRATPSSSGEKLITVPLDTIIEIIVEENGWYKLTYQSHTGWVAGEYVDIVENNTSDTNGSSDAVPVENEDPSPDDSIPEISIDLSVNGTVFILGGSGVISPTTQSIIEGKTQSKHPENLREFPALPSKIKTEEEPPQSGEVPGTTLPPESDDLVYDPSQEVLVDPFAGIPELALAGKTIMIDPGHGGPDVGAVGPSKTYEKDNTLGIALALKDILTQAGAEVLMTREEDCSPAAKYTELEDLKARVALANSYNTDLFISIHNDAFTNPDTNGTSVYYSSANPKRNESLHLAGSIRTAVISTLNSRDRGVKQAAFYVLKNTKMPSILLETAFISNTYEEARLQNPTFRQNVAAGIFRGIYAFYTTPLPKD